MRLKLVLCGVSALLPSLLLAGCGMEPVSTVAPTSNVSSPALSGRSYAGQQPVTGATIEVVAMGTAGYGSTGTVLATTTTDANGNFGFAANAYTCPQSNTPVYLMGIGGNTGAGVNPNAVLGAALGTCSVAKNSYVIMNEVTTTALAFSLSHFFSTTFGGSAGGTDWFGGPSTSASGTVQYSKGLWMGDVYTAQTIVFNAIGAPNQTTSRFSVEWQKINTIANILSACVNSTGETSTSETATPCGKLFNWTANGAVPRPSDTLQAAVMMALHPTTQITNLFNSGTYAQAPFQGLGSAPNDWSIGVSYPTSALGLAVNTGTMTTLDIDSNGNIWFPSNTSGHVGVAYFDPTTQTFFGPFNGGGQGDPQQVVIDANGYAWANDLTNSGRVAGYLTTSPTTMQTGFQSGVITNSLTVLGNDTLIFGISIGSANWLATYSPDRTTYEPVTGISFPFPQTSMAGQDNNGGVTTLTNLSGPIMENYTVSAQGATTDRVNAIDYSGQVIYTGNDDISVRSYSGTGIVNDGLCIYSLAACYDFANGTSAVTTSAKGMAIDGGGQLWVAESGNGGLLMVPVNDPSKTFGSVYLNSSTGANIPVNELAHGSTAPGGGTATATSPYGLGIDAEGNVWMTNANCVGTGCTPTGNFTLTEIVGAAYPTITPVSAQITHGNLVASEPTQ